MAQHVHLIGIGGIGMSAVARLLLGQGARVTGSDSKPSLLTKALEKEGAQIVVEGGELFFQPDTVVIYSSDIAKGHKERVVAEQMGLKTLHRSEMLATFVRQHSMAVAGTHGKTTSSALLTFLLQEAGLDPSYAIGGILCNRGNNAGWGSGPFVFEADESDGSFLNYHPQRALLTNIDDDHLNHYGSLHALKAAFFQFASQVKTDLVWCRDDPQLASLNLSGCSYGFSPDATLQIRKEAMVHREGLTSFWLGDLGRFDCPLMGDHNLLNCAGVIALALAAGASLDKLKEALPHFLGTKRRCERKALHQPYLFFDDYAHHPTEVRATLQGLRARYPSRRLLAIFQPHRYSRVQLCFDQWAQAFQEPDLLMITDIYSAGEAPIEGVTTPALIEKLSRSALYVPFEKIVEAIREHAQAEDLVVTLGAGSITQIGEML